MKLNLDCIKDVMVFLEDNLTDDNAFVPNQIYESLEKYSYEDVEYTVKALLSEKWIAGIVQEIGGLYIVKSITPDGHNYLNAIKDESIYKIIKKGFKTGYIVCVALILTGALGNIIDSVFYGVIFNESTHSQIASFMPEGGGYSTWFYGKVVDMFYFPIIDTNWPTWMPFVGGEHFIFFSPIFNFADAAISCGIIALLLFYSKYLNESYHSLDKDKKEATDHEK